MQTDVPTASRKSGVAHQAAPVLFSRTQKIVEDIERQVGRCFLTY